MLSPSLLTMLTMLTVLVIWFTGILIKTLPKLADTKGADKKTTLMDFLHYSLMRAAKSDPQLVKFTTELAACKEATESSVKGLQAEVSDPVIQFTDLL